MTAHERSQTARLAADEGRHDEVLREYIWFQHHALETEPSLRGVRLSFALNYWMELAAKYPPALVAIELIRDGKTDALLSGTGDLDTFRDVESINCYLNSVPRTHALFANIATTNPLLAQQCAREAFQALIAAGDFALAVRFLPESKNHIRLVAETLNEDVLAVDSASESNAPILLAHVYHYVREVRQVLAILTGAGRVDESLHTRDLALVLVQANNVREIVEDGLAATDSELLDGSWFAALLQRTGFPL